MGLLWEVDCVLEGRDGFCVDWKQNVLYTEGRMRMGLTWGTKALFLLHADPYREGMLHIENCYAVHLAIEFLGCSYSQYQGVSIANKIFQTHAGLKGKYIRIPLTANPS